MLQRALFLPIGAMVVVIVAANILVQSVIAFALLFAAHKVARRLTGIGLW